MHKPTETENKIKMKDAERYKAIYCMDLPEWLQDFREFWSVKAVLQSHGGNPAPEDQDHCPVTHFPKDPNCDICLKTKITRASCRKRAGTVVPRAAIFGDLAIFANDNILSEER